MAIKTRDKPSPGTDDSWTTPPVSLEDQLYSILHQAMEREDAAAKASARLDRDLVMAQVEAQAQAEDPTLVQDLPRDHQVASAPTGPVRGLFDDQEFDYLFKNLSTLRLAQDLLQLLGLQSLASEVMSLLIHTSFSPATPVTTSKPGPQGTVVGTDAEMMLYQLRRLSERTQKQQRNRTGTAG